MPALTRTPTHWSACALALGLQGWGHTRSCGLPSGLGCLSQDGDFSFSLESVKKLKDLQDLPQPKLGSLSKLVSRLGQPVVPMSCSHAAFPEELSPVCQEPNAEEILQRLGERPPLGRLGWALEEETFCGWWGSEKRPRSHWWV